MTGTPYDVVVVGGGPVGLFTAIAAAEAHLSVAVVEPRTDPIDKACGEGLMFRALQQLATMGVDPDGRPFHGITYLDALGERQASASFHGRSGRGVRRVVLHEALSLRAKLAGVERVQDRVRTVSQDDDRATVQCDNGSALTGKYVVGADGLHSLVRRELGLEPRPTRHPRFGLRQHFLVRPWTDDVEVYWAEDSEAYVTPVADDVVGVAVLGGRSSGAFDDRIENFPALRRRLLDAETVGAVAGAGPLRQAVRARGHGRVWLVGDAAGYVDALTGEGLAVGFRTASSLVAAITDLDLDRYEREWHAVTREYRFLTQVLVGATRHRALRNRLVPAASRFPRLFERAVARLA
jgi:flavin-dependent dehydrogenase